MKLQPLYLSLFILAGLFVGNLIIGNKVVYAHEVSDQDGVNIHISDTGFDKTEITLEQGQSVTFENIGKSEHWPASDIHPTHNVYPEFDPKRALIPGESWSFTFDKAGVWRFHDHLFPSFVGQINVNPNLESEREESNPKANTTISLMSRVNALFDDTKLYIKKLYFKIYPEKAEKELSSINVSGLAIDEQKLTIALKLFGPKKIMNKLLIESGNNTTSDCHQAAHEIGRVSYQIYGMNAFRDTIYNCISGYPHGITEAFLRDVGTADLSKKADQLCEDLETHFARFECLHGIGHGVMAYYSNDLPKAINECKKLKDTTTQSACYGGVFMENLIQGQNQGLGVGHETKWISNDPLFPCNSLEDNYDLKYQCYQMQTARILFLNQYDWKNTVNTCLTAEENMIDVCFKSMGRDASGATLRNIDKTLNICEMVPKKNDYYYECINGAVNVVVDTYGDSLKNQANEFCNKIPYESEKSRCLKVVELRKDGIGIN